MTRFGIFVLLITTLLATHDAAAGPTVPPDAIALKCETMAAKQLAKLFGCVAKCRMQAATQAFKGAPFDEGACATGPTASQHSCAEKYAAASATLLAKNPCPPCLDPTSIGTNVIGVMKNTFAGALYCAGATTYPAPHAAPPTLMSFGGSVLATPHIHPVTFANDDPTRTATLSDFLATPATASYLAATAAEYGVGAVTVAPTIALTETSPNHLSDDEVQAWLAAKLDAADPAFPAIDATTLFVLFYPATTTIALGGGDSCQAFTSYHSEVTLDAAHGNAVVPYVVVPACNGVGGPTSIEVATLAASRAIVGALTDPRPLSAPAYAGVDGDHIVWQLVLGGGEACDLCAQSASSAATTLAPSGYVVSRCWSNAAATAGHDPCVPAPPSEAYFAAAPTLPDTVTLPGIGTTKSVEIPAGTSRTVSVALFSDAATTGPIAVTAVETGGGSPHLAFSFDQTQGLNGDTLSLTILATGSFAYDSFIVSATVGTEHHLWVGLVTQ